jgi:hypothetical protein
MKEIKNPDKTKKISTPTSPDLIILAKNWKAPACELNQQADS